MDFLDMGLMVWLVVLAAWGVARLWLTPAEIGERLGRGLRQVRRGRVGRFAARHRKATTVVLGLAVLAVAPFALSAALLLAIAAVMAWVFPDEPSVNEDERSYDDGVGYYYFDPVTMTASPDAPPELDKTASMVCGYDAAWDGTPIRH